MADKSAPLLELRGLTKSFAGVRVLSSVDLAIRPGEVHALIGQNGSGKSTIIKILSGYHQPDGGEVFMRGERVPLPLRPGQPGRLGLRFLHQDVGVVRTMTVLENLADRPVPDDGLRPATLERRATRSEGDARRNAARYRSGYPRA